MMRKIIQSLICLLLATHVALASQATLVTPGAPLPMTSLATFLNAAFLSIGSQNSGASAPINGPGAAPFAGETWCNTTAALWVCSLYDGTNWNQYGTLDTAGHRFTPFMGASLVNGGLPYGASATTIGWTAAGGADQFFQGGSAPGWASFPNCTGALTYSTSTHTVGCSASAGTGTVTSVGSGTGVTASPNPITTSGTVAVDQTFSPTWSGTHKFTGNVYFGSGRPFVDIRSGANGCLAAAGDGVTNDGPAIQCQINFMNSNYAGGIVYAPPGTYLIGSINTLTIKGAVQFVGAAADATTVKVTTDTQVIQIDSSPFGGGTCGNYPAIENMTILGYQNSAATQNAVQIGINCPAIIRDDNIFGGFYGLYTAGVDGIVENSYICGVASGGGGISSQGANWYVRVKIDTCAFMTTEGFLQGTYLGPGGVTAIAENHFVECDFSGAYTRSLHVDDGANHSAMTVINGGVFSRAILISNGLATILSDAELGSTSLASNNPIIVHGSYAFSATTVSGSGTRSCAANINVTC